MKRVLIVSAITALLALGVSVAWATITPGIIQLDDLTETLTATVVQQVV